MATDSRNAASLNDSLTPNESFNASSKTYGYIWADWLYGHDKDFFMVEIYNNCKEIDTCTDPTEKAAKLLFLHNKVRSSKKPYVEGIEDFIGFESQSLAAGVAPLDVLHNTEDYRAIAILHAAYLHGAFRGVCRTVSGAEWIGILGEFCAAAVHQGFKYVRRSGGVSDWELPALGETWCKGAALWGLVSLYMAVDLAGSDPSNDAALDRVHRVIAAHHLAGSSWLKYRGAHPHKQWNAEVRGKAPTEVSIRDFGTKHGWPEEMIGILCRAARHVNSWKNPPFDPVHQERMRSLLICDHTPRLMSRSTQLGAELAQLVGDATEAEADEINSRTSSWMATCTSFWRGRGDCNDRVAEISALGAVLGVIRESRPHIPIEFVDRAMSWSTERTSHLPPEMQDL